MPYYSNSGDTTGDRSKVAGYAAIVFYGDNAMGYHIENTEIFTKEQGRVLVELARQTIMEKLGSKIDNIKADKLADRLKDQKFENRYGTFVTINSEDRLRGCIGNLSAQGTVLEGIRENAINAAFPIILYKSIDDLKLSDGDKIRVNFETGEVTNLKNNKVIHAENFSEVQMEIYQNGGLF